MAFIAVGLAAVLVITAGGTGGSDNSNAPKLKNEESRAVARVGPQQRSTTTVPVASTARAPLPSFASLIGSMDGNQLTGGLGAFISNALALKDGKAALTAAKALTDCGVISESVRAWQNRAMQSNDDVVHKFFLEEYERVVKLEQQCSAVQGDHEQLKRDLLSIASAQHIQGSHARLLLEPAAKGVRHKHEDDIKLSELQLFALSDANAGDLMSMAYIASLAEAGTSGVSRVDILAARAALLTLDASPNLAVSSLAAGPLGEAFAHAEARFERRELDANTQHRAAELIDAFLRQSGMRQSMNALKSPADPRQ